MSRGLRPRLNALTALIFAFATLGTGVGAGYAATGAEPPGEAASGISSDGTTTTDDQLRADASPEAMDSGADSTPLPGCVTRLGVASGCVLPLDSRTVVDATDVPPGLRIESDGSVSGTPTAHGIWVTSLAFDDGSVERRSIAVSDVDYIAVTVSTDQKTVIGTKWNGTRVTLATAVNSAVGSLFIDAAVAPNGRVYAQTRTQLLRIVQPNVTSIVIAGLEANAMDIGPTGDIHIANRTDVITYRDGEQFRRARQLLIADVVEDGRGNIWTVEPGKVVKQDFETGLYTEFPFTDDVPRTIAASRGLVYVAVDAKKQANVTKVLAMDAEGAVIATLLERPGAADRLSFSELGGLVLPHAPGNRLFRWAAPIDAADFLPSTFRVASAPRHLQFVEPPALLVKSVFELQPGEKNALPGRLRLVHHFDVTWKGESTLFTVDAQGTVTPRLNAKGGTDFIPAVASAPGLTGEHEVVGKATHFPAVVEHHVLLGAPVDYADDDPVHYTDYPVTVKSAAIPRGLTVAGGRVTGKAWEGGTFDTVYEVKLPSRTLTVTSRLVPATPTPWHYIEVPVDKPIGIPAEIQDRTCPASHPFVWSVTPDPSRGLPPGITVTTNGASFTVVAKGMTGGEFGTLKGFTDMTATKASAGAGATIRLTCVNDLRDAAFG